MPYYRIIGVAVNSALGDYFLYSLQPVLASVISCKAFVYGGYSAAKLCNLFRNFFVFGFIIRKCRGQLIGNGISKTDCKGSLRVGIYQQDFLSLHCQSHTQIFTDRCFASTAFLVDYGNNSCFLWHTTSPLFSS